LANLALTPSTSTGQGGGLKSGGAGSLYVGSITSVRKLNIGIAKEGGEGRAKWSTEKRSL